MDEGFLLFLPTRTVLFFFMTDENEAKECLWEGRGRNPTGSGSSVGRKQVSVFFMHIRASKRGSNYSGILVFFFLFLHPFLGMLHLPTLAFCRSVVFASVDDAEMEPGR